MLPMDAAMPLSLGALSSLSSKASPGALGMGASTVVAIWHSALLLVIISIATSTQQAVVQGG
jgi:hypothetical protein